MASYGARERHWFICRPKDATAPHGPMDMLSDKRGRTRWFGSYESASRALQRRTRAGNDLLTNGLYRIV